MSEINIPERHDYEQLTPFKLFVKSNFPFIEATFEALDNYGLYCEIVKYLNQVISNQNKTNEDIITFTDFVTNYFYNLDVQEEINNKLDELVENGTLLELIGNYIDPYINQQNVRINEIDRKVDRATSGSPLVATSTSGMTDTNRIYVNTTNGYWYYYNGTQWTQGGIYQSTGISESDTVISNIIDDITNSTGNTRIDYTLEGYIKTNVSVGNVVDLTPQSQIAGYHWKYAIVNCSSGDKFSISGIGGATPRLWAFVDANNIMLAVSDPNITVDNLTLTAPTNANKLIINTNSDAPCYYNERLVTKVNSMTDNVDNLLNFKKNNLNDVIIPRSNGQGIINANGDIVRTNYQYGYVTEFCHIKKGSYMYVESGFTFYAVKYTLSNNTFTVESRQTGLKSLKFANDGWYRFSIINDDHTQLGEESYISKLHGYIFTDNDKGTTKYIDNYADLIRACWDINTINIEIVNDIQAVLLYNQDNVEGYVLTRGNKVINGNGHTITGDENLLHLIVAKSGNITIKDLKLKRANGTVLDIQNDATCTVVRCEISEAGYQSSVGGDGIGTHSTSIVKVYDSLIHDCLDEGFSSHDFSYCEIYNTEAYNCGYNLGTTTPSGLSFGGLHLGGTKMGIIKNCYCHDNSSNGITFAQMLTDEEQTGKVVCVNNICLNNDTSGIAVSSIKDIECYKNLSYNNTNGISFSKRRGMDFGCKGTVFSNNVYGNSTNPILNPTGADDGLILFDNVS